jgi:Protein kinase domain
MSPSPAEPRDSVADVARSSSGSGSVASPGAYERLRAELAQRDLVLERELGRGGTSTVYQAVDRRHERVVAVKVLRSEIAASLGAERFVREIKLVAQLHHPHILPLFDSGAAAGTLYYVMPYVEGESLRARLTREHRLPVSDAVAIAREVADALEYAHARGVIHRDVKPENILLEAGHAVVADFGVALAVSRAAGDRDPKQRLTEAGLALGTMQYMSPEQVTGDPQLDARSDIYSLGCVLYEMLAGEPPFTGANQQAILAKRFTGPPPPLQQLRPDVPEALQAAVMTALATDPADRFASARDFAAALEAPGFTPAGARALPRGRRRTAWALIRGLALIAMAVLGVLFLRDYRSPPLDPRRLVVAVFSNETGDSALAPLGHMAADWITDALVRDGTLEVVGSAVVMPLRREMGAAASDDLSGPQRIRALAEATRTGKVVSGSYYRQRRQIDFFVEITNAANGELLRAIGPVRGTLDAPERAASELSRLVTAAVDSLFRARAPSANRTRGAT